MHTARAGGQSEEIAHFSGWIYRSGVCITIIGCAGYVIPNALYKILVYRNGGTQNGYIE